jgi:hypothetical protein
MLFLSSLQIALFCLHFYNLMFGKQGRTLKYSKVTRKFSDNNHMKKWYWCLISSNTIQNYKILHYKYCHYVWDVSIIIYLFTKRKIWERHEEEWEHGHYFVSLRLLLLCLSQQCKDVQVTARISSDNYGKVIESRCTLHVVRMS